MKVNFVQNVNAGNDKELNEQFFKCWNDRNWLTNRLPENFGEQPGNCNRVKIQVGVIYNPYHFK